MKSGRSIDHVVLTVRDLAAAAATFEAQGFTLTPRAQHEARMGTANRLAQFSEHNFIELLEVDRPDGIAPYDEGADPPAFSFGEFNRRWAAAREGLSMLVFATDDARADLAAFKARGITTSAPYDFERSATLPDGTTVTVGFSLAFATSPDMPNVAFFVCQNRFPENFWKPPFQQHTNGVTGIRAIQLVSPEPARDAAFVGSLFDGAVVEIADGLAVACGKNQRVEVLGLDAMAARDATFAAAPGDGALFAGLTLNAAAARAVVPASSACGASLSLVDA